MVEALLPTRRIVTGHNADGNDSDPKLSALTLPPRRNGKRIRHTDISPDTEDFPRNGAGKMMAAFAEIDDESEVTLTPGSVVVQHATNHAWANRSGKTARMLFILIDGKYEPELEVSLERQE
jgi:hypothetical protein